MRRDPANPTWDSWLIPGGIPPIFGGIPPGIPSGIMEHPRWDPTWDPANPTWDPAYHSRYPGGIPPIPPGIPASLHAKSRQSHLATYICPRWDPTNPTWDPRFVLGEIPSGINLTNLTWGFMYLFVTQTGSNLLSFVITHKSQFLEHV